LEEFLFEHLALLPEICAMKGGGTREQLGDLLCRFLAKHEWDDDATIGVLISKTARDLLALR
jgi:hypothetical protein